MHFFRILCLLLFSLALFAQNEKDPASISIWELSDPDGLNPLTSTSANAHYIENNIFSRLLERDPQSLELKPQLAIARPELKKIEQGPYKGGMSLSYEIHPHAKWDDGLPVTAADYIFTVKALKNPLVDARSTRPYYNFIDHIEVDPKNPKRFSIYSKTSYFLAEEASGDLHILPKHLYDPEGLMQAYTINTLNNSSEDRLKQDSSLQKFAQAFNARKYEQELVVGSHAYQLVKWELGQELVLERKKDWWGDEGKNYADSSFQYPQRLHYRVIRDQNTAITALKAGEVDLMRSVKPSKFLELKDDKTLDHRFHFFSPNQLAYYYIGFNCKNPKLSDKKTRQALAHLINREELIEILFEGMAIKVESPINPSKDYYNHQLKARQFDLEKAKTLLAEAGWKDSDGDGILDKEIEGALVPLRLEYKYNRGNEIRKNIGFLLKEEAKKVGIEIQISTKGWLGFLEDLKHQNFELMCAGWAQGPGLDDLKQLWHSASDTPDGGNRIGFRNEEVDALIEEINNTLDAKARQKMYFRIQEIIQEEQPYIFLVCPAERIIISKRVLNAQGSALRPGYQEQYFKLAK